MESGSTFYCPKDEDMNPNPNIIGMLLDDDSNSGLSGSFTFSGMNNIEEVVVRRSVPQQNLPRFSCKGGGVQRGIGVGNGVTIGSPPEKIMWRKLGKDKCADRGALNVRQKNKATQQKNKEIQDLTTQKGREHAYSTMIDLATGEVVGYTAILEGKLEPGRQSVDTKESWNYSGQQNKWTATVEYTHTHGFQSAPSNIDVFAGIMPYIDSGPNAMGQLKRQII